MGTITIGNRSFEIPILVPSISSFETQLKPLDALRLQYTLHEPISLVSAYDVWADRDSLVRLTSEFRKQGAILLDSGGYESSRISRYARDRLKDSIWDFNRYADIASEEIYDYIFSFDYFMMHEESASQFEERLVRELREHASILDIRKLIPVVHLCTYDGRKGLSDEQITELFANVVSQLECRFVAVPERELGSGITVRAQLTKKIVSSIRLNAKSDCDLHILGCGNLLSFALLSVAGAAMCDGLEWCRTFAADQFHLHHFQHKEIFADPRYHLQNPAAEFMVEDGRLDYHTAVALRNLLSFQVYTQGLHDKLRVKRAHEFVGHNFGNMAGEAARMLET